MRTIQAGRHICRTDPFNHGRYENTTIVQCECETYYEVTVSDTGNFLHWRKLSKRQVKRLSTRKDSAHD